MQLIFRYDLTRLYSYSVHAENNIKIIDEHSHVILCFPEVDYFNYSFHKEGEVFTKQKLSDVSAFYLDNRIRKHKILVEASSAENNKSLAGDSRYRLVSTIAKTGLPVQNKIPFQPIEDMRFVKADNTNIQDFTDVYINSFEALKKDNTSVYNNFKTLLMIPHLDLYILQHEGVNVGVNVLYQQDCECLLAGGAILPRYRNKGFHKKGLSFRIGQTLTDSTEKNIVAWAYNPSISLNNMLKLNMQIEEEFNVYEYCK